MEERNLKRRRGIGIKKIKDNFVTLTRSNDVSKRASFLDLKKGETQSIVRFKIGSIIQLSLEHKYNRVN